MSWFMVHHCGVLMAFYGNQDIAVITKLSDEKVRILNLDTCIDDFDFLLIDIYNANMKKKGESVFLTN